jgi:hypothetical protein
MQASGRAEDRNSHCLFHQLPRSHWAVVGCSSSSRPLLPACLLGECVQVHGCGIRVCLLRRKVQCQTSTLGVFQLRVLALTY